MKINNIKSLLASDDIQANQVNPIIDCIDIQEIDQLTELEKTALRELVNAMLLLSQDSNYGAYLNSPDKARAILEALG